MPVLTVFAGPNGSGKSSLIKQVEFEGRQNLLEADAIALRLNQACPQQSGIAAGREVLLRTAQYLRDEVSFAIETTLSGNWTDSAISGALQRSYSTRFFYICLDNPERSIQRVRERVRLGGHDVPDKDVRRRYGRSIVNARRILRVVHHGFVFDNSDDEPRQIIEMRDGKVLSAAEKMPAWAMTLLE